MDHRVKRTALTFGTMFESSHLDNIKERGVELDDDDVALLCRDMWGAVMSASSWL